MEIDFLLNALRELPCFWVGIPMKVIGVPG